MLSFGVRPIRLDTKPKERKGPKRPKGPKIAFLVLFFGPFGRLGPFRPFRPFVLFSPNGLRPRPSRALLHPNGQDARRH